MTRSDRQAGSTLTWNPQCAELGHIASWEPHGHLHGALAGLGTQAGQHQEAWPQDAGQHRDWQTQGSRQEVATAPTSHTGGGAASAALGWAAGGGATAEGAGRRALGAAGVAPGG